MLGDWLQVTIQDPNSDVAASSAEGLVNGFSQARRDKMLLPDDAPVFYGITNTSDYVFYFSPAAIEVGIEVLRGYSTTSCKQPDAEDLRNLKKVS